MLHRNSIAYLRTLALSLCTTVALVSMSFSGCNQLKNTVGEKEVNKPEAAPEWVGSRPHNGAYYIGIGTCSKTTQPLDYQAIAKKNALNDLASEISVRIQGQTFLNSLEVNKNFSEEFISTISTTTDEKIEDYEVAGQWEDKDEYWIYYKLSKTSYQQAKLAKKNAALSQAHDYYVKGGDAEKLANIPAAFDLYMHGLFAMKEYWDEVNEYTTHEGVKIYLDNEMYASMQRIAGGLRFSVPVQKIILSSDNAYNSTISITVLYNSTPARGITVMHNYQRPRYMKPRSGITDANGQVTASINDVSTVEKVNNLDLIFDLHPFIAEDLDLMIQKGLIKTMKTETMQVPIELVTPSFYITSSEKNYGNEATTAVLASTLNTELVKKGMRISQVNNETNYKLNITANTTAGGTSQGFTVAYLEFTITITNAVSGETVYQESLSSIKGLQLNADAASMEAYKKGKEKIETEIVKSLLDAIM
ncbi:MAG: LPP20 family lipoprotein [Flavobacteriales bacterium]